ncbi:hypothetical protein EQV77_06310 [Halobacillus fulvus]|nr:hypothetical protein EQV77_06310 [Halobacillus fulvus]
MKKFSFLLFSLLLLTACNTSQSLSYTEVQKENMNEDALSFFQSMKAKNGVHLYFDEQNDAVFTYLNASNVAQGEQALNFTSFDLENEADTLKVFYESESTSDYSDSSNVHEQFYRLDLDQNYESIRLFQNGIESSFGTISGN